MYLDVLVALVLSGDLLHMSVLGAAGKVGACLCLKSADVC